MVPVGQVINRIGLRGSDARSCPHVIGAKKNNITANIFTIFTPGSSV